jgi:hypothetical protein
MSNLILDGDAQLGADGVLQGWCWSAKRPTERLALEILINEKIVSTLVASRFREDLREKRIGDGYHGFMATLTKSLADAGDNYVISARERSSGRCFWQHARGELGLPNDFATRFAEAQHQFSRIARSSPFLTLGNGSLTSRISIELGTLGMRLRAATGLDTRYPFPVARVRAALLRETAPVVLEILPHPKLALIIIADSTSKEILSTVSAVIPTLQSMEGSLLLIDRGVNAEVALAPSIFGNLRYVFYSREDLGSLLSVALKYSHGELLIFIRNPPESITHGLPELVAQTHASNAIYINSRSVEIACAICTESSANISRRPANFPLGLEFAGKREAFERLRDIVPLENGATGLGNVELAIRAIRHGVDICAWDEPHLVRRSGIRAEATH